MAGAVPAGARSILAAILVLGLASCVVVEYRGLTLPPTSSILVFQDPEEVPEGFVEMGRAVVETSQLASRSRGIAAVLEKARAVGADAVLIRRPRTQRADEPERGARDPERRRPTSWADPSAWSAVRSVQGDEDRILATFLMRGTPKQRMRSRGGSRTPEPTRGV